jgi:rRNA maturation endonuclease Nob1
LVNSKTKEYVFKEVDKTRDKISDKMREHINLAIEMQEEEKRVKELMGDDPTSLTNYPNIATLNKIKGLIFV